MEKPEVSEKDRKRHSGDLIDRGNDYDKRLSIRCHQRHIDYVDILSELNKQSRNDFVREFIEKAYKRAVKEGLVK